MCFLCKNNLLPVERMPVEGILLTEAGVNAVITNLRERNKTLSEENSRLKKRLFERDPIRLVDIRYA